MATREETVQLGGSHCEWFHTKAGSKRPGATRKFDSVSAPDRSALEQSSIVIVRDCQLSQQLVPSTIGQGQIEMSSRFIRPPDQFRQATENARHRSRAMKRARDDAQPRIWPEERVQFLGVVPQAGVDHEFREVCERRDVVV